MDREVVKYCSKCEVYRSVSLFQKDSNKKDGLYSSCKQHAKAKHDPKKKAEYDRRYRKIYFEIKRANNYGLTPLQLNELVIKQNNRCAVCKKPETAKSSQGDGKVKELAVDHCHKTGRVRGLLCQRCNSGIGQFRDSPELLVSAAEYLKI